MFHRMLPAVLLAGTLAVTGCPRSESRVEKRIAEAEAAIQELDVGFKTYAIDRCGIYMPPDTSWRAPGSRTPWLTLETDPEVIRAAQEAGGPGAPAEFHHPLTTPIAYMKGIPGDPFRKGQPWGFISIDSQAGLRGFAVLHSPGPDEDTDLNPEKLREWAVEHGVVLRTQTASSVRLAAERILPYAYDPTNGTFSSGDYLAVFIGMRRTMGSGMPEFELPGLAMIQKEARESGTIMAAFVEASDQPILPAAFFTALGIVPHPDEMMQQHLFQLMGNKLGPSFSETLANAESREVIIEENATWFSAIEQTTFSTRVRYAAPRDSSFAVLPLIGKSALLFAVHQNEPGRIADLEAFLKTIAPENEEEHRIKLALLEHCAEAKDLLAVVNL